MKSRITEVIKLKPVGALHFSVDNPIEIFQCGQAGKSPLRCWMKALQPLSPFSLAAAPFRKSLGKFPMNDENILYFWSYRLFMQNMAYCNDCQEKIWPILSHAGTYILMIYPQPRFDRQLTEY